VERLLLTASLLFTLSTPVGLLRRYMNHSMLNIWSSLVVVVVVLRVAVAVVAEVLAVIERPQGLVFLDLSLSRLALAVPVPLFLTVLAPTALTACFLQLLLQGAVVVVMNSVTVVLAVLVVVVVEAGLVHLVFLAKVITAVTALTQLAYPAAAAAALVMLEPMRHFSKAVMAAQV
jgi:hypothetical protein